MDDFRFVVVHRTGTDATERVPPKRKPAQNHAYKIIAPPFLRIPLPHSGNLCHLCNLWMFPPLRLTSDLCLLTADL